MEYALAYALACKAYSLRPLTPNSACPSQMSRLTCLNARSLRCPHRTYRVLHAACLAHRQGGFAVHSELPDVLSSFHGMVTKSLPQHCFKLVEKEAKQARTELTSSVVP